MKAARIAVIAALSMIPLSCGGSPEESAAPGSTTDSYSTLQISSAQWSDGPEPRAVVSGEWSIGVSSPPACDLIRAENGESSDWYDPQHGTRVDGGSFSREFVPNPNVERPSGPRRGVEYSVRCKVSRSTGSTVEATAPIQGSPPAVQE